MRLRGALMLAGFLAVPGTALAKGQVEARALAACAWQKVPQTAAALAKIVPKKRVLYDDVSAPGAAPFMRVYAACGAEKRALSATVVEPGTRFSQAEVPYLLLTSLKKAQPVSISVDSFTARVFRCESRFADVASNAVPAKIWWGYGDTPFAASLGARGQVFNNQVPITDADLAAIEKGGDGIRKLHDLLTQGQAQEVGEFETYGAGIASGKAFTIKPTEKNSMCRTVAPTGELTDA